MPDGTTLRKEVYQNFLGQQSSYTIFYIPRGDGGCYITIFSIGTTRIPCAPAPFNRSIMSQKSFSLNTLCTLLQPASASGSTVGLFIPGSSAMISCSLSFGAFNKTYLVLRALFTARMRNRNFSRICCFGSSRYLFRISTACGCNTAST